MIFKIRQQACDGMKDLFVLSEVLIIKVISQPFRRCDYLDVPKGTEPGALLLGAHHSPVTHWSRIPLPMQETPETQVPSLDGEEALEEETATHSSIPACKIPLTEKPGRLQFMGWKKSWTQLSE